MDDNQAHKRAHNDDDEPTMKRPRCAPATPEPPKTSIADLNSLCLQHIFEYLDVIDLVNVSHVMDQRSRDVTDYVFKRKFGHVEEFEFKSNGIQLNDSYDERTIAATIADLCGLLKHFGQYMRAIYISDYDLSVHGEDDSTAVLFDYIGQPFPHMRSFTMENLAVAHTPNLMKMIELNPQLVNLELYVGAHETSAHEAGDYVAVDRRLLDAIANLPNLEYLITVPLGVTMPAHINRNAKTAALFGAILPDATVDDSRKSIPYTFERLSSLELHDCMVWNSEWTKFVGRHANLNSLTIDCGRFCDLPVNIEEIAAQLPGLTHLWVCGCTVFLRNIDWILSEHKAIKYLKIKGVYDDTMGQVRNIEHFTGMDYADNWRIYHTDDSFCFTRNVESD